jgi:hypothetical protein
MNNIKVMNTIKDFSKIIPFSYINEPVEKKVNVKTIAPSNIAFGIILNRKTLNMS